jgi:hypothetical protein
MEIQQEVATMATLNGCGSDLSSPDSDGDPTGGCYNGDYSQEVQDDLNRRLEADEYYEAEQTQAIQDLYDNWKNR